MGGTPEGRAYSREQMSHPAYKPPSPALCTKVKVTKGEVYLQDTTVLAVMGQCYVYHTRDLKWCFF